MLLEDICSIAERIDCDEAIEIQDMASRALEILVHPGSPFISDEDALDFNSDDLWADEDLRGLDDDEREV